MQELKAQIKEFIRERDWEKYHAPKSLAMALNVETSEMLEIFQWNGSQERLTKKEQEALRQEIGDVLIYLIELADKFEIDIIKAAKEKLTLNEKKYPADLVRGKAEKYSDYD
jgi:NTP pyrophosphatase (non-canonical NTP hydrolase)